jgi:TorA maturation chaperone TorD
MIKETDDKLNKLLKGYNMLLYFAGTMIMFDPSRECIHDFWTQGILKNLPVSSRNPRFIEAASQLRESVDNQKSSYGMMKEDYLILFTDKGTPKAPPYESLYRSKDHKTSKKKPAEVEDFYRSYGWESKFKGKIADDHLGVELLFLTLMIEKLMEFDDDLSSTEMKNEIRRFIRLHLMSWIPDWNMKVQQNALTISYKGICTLILSCVEDIYIIMSQGNTDHN